MVYIQALIGRLLLYPYLMYKGSRLMPARWASGLYWLLIVELGLALLGVIVHYFVQHPWMSALMSASLFWFFSVGYAGAFLLGLSVVRRLVAWVAPGLYRPGARARAVIEWGVALLSLAVVLTTMVVGYRNVRYPRVVYRTLDLSSRADALGRELRLVLLTDLHIGEGITPGYVDRAVELAMAQHPDLVLVGGDYIDHYSRYAYEPEVQQAMRRLADAPHGVYYVAGNHEYRADSIAKLRWVETVGGTLLMDSIAYPGEGYAVIGRDDYVHQGSRLALSALTDRLPERMPLTILLEHTPKELDSLEYQPIDLALYGHTHGGQLMPNQLSVWLAYGVVSGLYHRGATEVYVSSGIGSAGAPYRVGTRSEIVVYNIKY